MKAELNSQNMTPELLKFITKEVLVEIESIGDCVTATMEIDNASIDHVLDASHLANSRRKMPSSPISVTIKIGGPLAIAYSKFVDMGITTGLVFCCNGVGKVALSVKLPQGDLTAAEEAAHEYLLVLREYISVELIAGVFVICEPE